MDGYAAQRGRQRGLPEDLEGVQDGETRKTCTHMQHAFVHISALKYFMEKKKKKSFLPGSFYTHKQTNSS